MVQGRRAAWGLAAVLGVPLAIAVAGSTSHAQDLMSLGTGAEIENVARIGNKQLPLPEGKWELVLSEADRRGSVQSGTAFLVRKANERIVGYLFVRTNLEIGGGIGWKRPRWCQRNNVHHNGSDKYYNKEDADCWIVNHRTYTNKVLRVEFYNRMKTYLRDHGATSTVVGHRYWRNDSTDYMLVSLFIDPGCLWVPAGTGQAVGGEPVARECGGRRHAAPRVRRRHEGLRQQVPRGSETRIPEPAGCRSTGPEVRLRTIGHAGCSERA